jgi:hypothetical protein
MSMVGGSGRSSSSSGTVFCSDVSNQSWRKSMNAQIHRWVEERAALAAGGRDSLSAGSLAPRIAVAWSHASLDLREFPDSCVLAGE